MDTVEAKIVTRSLQIHVSGADAAVDAPHLRLTATNFWFGAPNFSPPFTSLHILGLEFVAMQDSTRRLLEHWILIGTVPIEGSVNFGIIHAWDSATVEHTRTLPYIIA